MVKKKIHIELLRIIAIYFVMFNHTSGYMFFLDNTEKPFYYLYLSFSVLCKIAVPIFFMITGALLLKKEETIKVLFHKRVFKFISILITVSLFYYLILNNNRSVLGFVKDFYSTNNPTSLWYLYSYIGVLLMLPILRKLVKTLTEKEYIYLFICHLFLVSVIPSLEYLLWQGDITINENFSAVIFTANNVFFVLLGYYSENVFSVDKITGKRTLVLYAAAVIAVVISCGMTNYVIRINGTEDKMLIESFFNSFISIPAFVTYVIVKKLCQKDISIKKEKIICEIGGSVFGAYLAEKCLRLATGFVYEFLSGIINPFAASAIWVISGMTLLLVTITIVKKIPFIGNYISKLI